jgi:GTP pyrophosphokinase
MEKIFEIQIEQGCPYGKNVDDDLRIFLDECRKTLRYNEVYNEDFIRAVFQFCYESHKAAERESGEPYYIHPLKVALYLLNELNIGDVPTIAAALLHDTVEDNQSVTIDMITSRFGKEVSSIVDGLTNIRGEKTRQLDKAATYYKLFSALVLDSRVIIIKLADRLDNMRTLQYLTEAKQKSIAHETLNLYTPIAQRLGLIKVKQELEDFSLYYTDRQAYETIRPALISKRMEFIDYIANFTSQVESKLNDFKIRHVITIEHKHIYEIYRMMEQGRSIDEIDNFYSMVISLMSNDFAECYRVYGIIASIFGPVSSLEDYISRPKINFYRALHSKHLGPNKKIVEIVIRTEDMDKIAEGGIAAVFSLKNGNKALELDEDEVKDWLQWMKEIIGEGDDDAIQKIWGSIRMNLYDEDILVQTTGGLSFRLPQQACVLDLAFALSEETGLHCISAKVNGNIRNIYHELRNDDFVEIITSPKNQPSHEWLDHVVTQKAVVRLYNFFKSHKENGISKQLADTVFKLRIAVEDRPQVVTEIKHIFGIDNIKRIKLLSSNSIIESVFTVNISEIQMQDVFVKLLGLKGLKSVERIDEEK